MQKDDITDYFGGVRKTAAAFGLTTQAIYLWPATVSKRIALEAQELSGGKLKYREKDYA